MISREHLRAYLNGRDEEFFYSLVREMPKLIFYAYSFVKEKEIASDITSEIFEKFIRYSVEERVEKVTDNPIYFKNLIYIIIKNKCIDHLRKESTRAKIIEEKKLGQKHTEFNKAESKFVEDAFKNLIEELGSRQKEILLMYVEGYSTAEIANSLEISINTVQNTLAVSKKKVSVLWDDFFEN